MNERQLRSDSLRQIFKKCGVTKAALFGSRARGEAKPDSDYDFLIEMEPDRTLFDLGGLKIDLEAKLGRRVDLVEYSVLHPLIKEKVLSQQIPVL